MLPRPLAADAWNGLLLGILGLSAVLLVSIWVASYQRLEAEQEAVLRSARVTQENLASILAENLEQVLDRGRLFSMVAAEWLDDPARGDHAQLAAMLAADRAFLRIALYDRGGRLIYASSLAADDGETVEAVLQMSADAGRHALTDVRLAPASRLDEKAWQVPLLYPIADAGGAHHGALLAELDLGYLLGLYREIDIGQTGTIQVLLSSGKVLAQARQGGLELSDETRTASWQASGAGPKGSALAADAAGGRTALTAYEGLGRYPFVALVSRELPDIMAGFAARRAKELSTIGIMSVLLVAGSVWILATVRRRKLSFAALARSEREKQELIVQLESERQKAFELASHDHLTGLPNRRLFHELATSHLARARRQRQHYAILFADLDRFKAINDTLGHRVGDMLLQTVAARLRASLRDCDVIARVGGDEFLVMLAGLDDPADAARIAAKLVDAVGRPCTNLDGNDIQVSPSIGIAVFPRDGQDVDTLTRHADLAMYQSKKAGRGTFTFFDPSLNTTSALQFALEQRLPRAIAEGELVLHFQPKIDLADYRICGLEALVRWQHPEHGVIYPGDFIPMAEASGLIVELGDWVIAEACRQMAAWKAAGLRAVPVAVNVSARQLRDAALVERIRSHLSRHRLGGACLEVEVTETSVMENIEAAGAVLRELVACGIGIALDDFGSGFSSLGYIKTLPIQTIKIDRSFIHDIRNSHDDAVIVAALIAMAHNLNMCVVAEGVEFRGQLIHLKTAGCDQVQGYYFSRPVAAEDVPRLLRTQYLLPA